MSRRYDQPDRTWSSDSHLLPAGIRHVPRRDTPGPPRPEDPPVRPWQQGEPARDRQPQRVRFQESYDDYDEYRPPPRPTPDRAYGGGRDQYTRHSLSLDSDLAAERLEKLERKERQLRLELDRELEGERRRRKESYDQPPHRSHSRSPPVVIRRRLARDRKEKRDEEHIRRSRSASPPERIIKAELYSDPESYDVGATTAETPSYEPPPHHWSIRSSATEYRDTSSDGEYSYTSERSDDSWDDELYNLGLYPDGKVYEFNPSHLSHRGSQDVSTTLSSSIGDVSTAGVNGEKGPRGPSPDPTLGAQTVLPHRIYQSEYTGDGFPEGSHAVKLTAILDSKRQRQPLFRWKHIEQSPMNFEKLTREVENIAGLSDADSHGLAKLLSDVKKYSIKSTPTSKGSNVKHMEPGLLQVKVDANAPTAKSAPPRTATWLCIPYFALQKYAGPLSTAAPGTFPTRTLLQEQYSGVSPDRDLQQVVCQTGHVPSHMCFHVAQLWCIVLDDSLLITCGTMTEPVLRADTVDLVTTPSMNTSGSASSFIFVYYTEAVTYALPLDQCRSWFAFISHFHEFWPKTLKFTHRDRLVTASDWPSIFNLARLSSNMVVLVLKLGAAPQPPTRGVLRSLAKSDEDESSNSNEDENESKVQSNLKPPNKGKENAATKDPIDPETQEDKFHLFSWLESFSASGESTSREQAESMRTQLQEMDNFLTNETKAQDRKAYQSCAEGTRLAALRYLEEQTDVGKKKSSLKRDFEDRVDIFNAADIVFRFFLPMESDGPTVGKYWGAIHRLVQMPEAPRSAGRDTAHSFRRSANSDSVIFPTKLALRELTQQIQSFTNILSHAQPLERAGITIPIQLIRAWVHLVMALVKASSNARSWHTHMDVAKALIKEGMGEVIQALPSEDLLAREVVLPMEVVSLLSLKLLRDSTGLYPNLDMIYSEYLNALDNEVATQPSERSFEHRINLLKQEATVILRIVAKQRRIFAAILPLGTRLPSYGPATFEPASKKRAIDEGDYYQPQAQPQALRSSELRRDRAYSRAPTVHDREGAGAGYYGAEEWYKADKTSPQPAPAGGGVEEIEPPREYYRLSPTQPGGFRDLLATDCLSLINQRYVAFSELFPYANYLSEYNKNKWEDTKDRQEQAKNRQEQAVYAFTIVTVVFLPLSAVASIFGMNTADVRDMEFSQWLFWVTAVPVTIGVILLGLWWMGELGNTFSWLPGVGRRNKGYAVVGGRKTRLGETGVPPVLLQGPPEDELNGPPVVRQAGAYVVRQRSVGPGYQYGELEAGGYRKRGGYVRPWGS